MSKLTPDYKLIYIDILKKKESDINEHCQTILTKDELTTLDILELNKKIFGEDNENDRFNQKCKSYNKSTIIEILEYQKKHNLNNSQVANHFNMSRNTIASWRKRFLV